MRSCSGISPLCSRRRRCSCPSSIQPCKHVVALALIAERHGLGERPSGGIQDRVDSRDWADPLVENDEPPQDHEPSLEDQ